MSSCSSLCCVCAFVWQSVRLVLLEQITERLLQRLWNMGEQSRAQEVQAGGWAGGAEAFESAESGHSDRGAAARVVKEEAHETSDDLCAQVLREMWEEMLAMAKDEVEEVEEEEGEEAAVCRGQEEGGQACNGGEHNAGHGTDDLEPSTLPSAPAPLSLSLCQAVQQVPQGSCSLLAAPHSGDCTSAAPAAEAGGWGPGVGASGCHAAALAAAPEGRKRRWLWQSCSGGHRWRGRDSSC